MPNFNKIAKELIGTSASAGDERLAILERSCPEVVRQIERDRGSSGPLIFWGRCQNVDEFAGQVIVDRSILETIFRIAGCRLDANHPHAGLQHTYGYLFSIIETPYGKKRDRWTSTHLEAGFGLPMDTLGPNPASGSLLANATWLAGNIAFRGSKRGAWLRRCLGARVSPALHNLELEVLPTLRSTETVSLGQSRGKSVNVSLQTDLVRMPYAESTPEPWLLVYSVNDSRQKYPALVTLFAVSDAFVDAIKERSRVSKRSDIRLRYNAWVSGLTLEPRPGKITIKTWTAGRKKSP